MIVTRQGGAAAGDGHGGVSSDGRRGNGELHCQLGGLGFQKIEVLVMLVVGVVNKIIVCSNGARGGNEDGSRVQYFMVQETRSPTAEGHHTIFASLNECNSL